MLVTTGNDVSGHEIVEYLGVVRGIVVRTPTIMQGLAGGVQQLLGGNIEAFTEVCETAREHAFEQMVDHASQLGADAVIAMRYDATDIGRGNATEVLAYGTAVRLTAVGRAV